MSEQKLKEEILNDAQKKAERIIKKAQSDAEKVIERAKKEVEEFRNQVISKANERAGKERVRILSSLPLEKQRSIRQAQENVMEKAISQAMEKLNNSDGFDYQRSIRELIIQGALAIDEETILCRARKKDIEIFTEVFVKETTDILRTKYQKSIIIKISSDEELNDNGVILESIEGRKKIYCNTYEMRLKRKIDGVRLKIAEIMKFI